MPRYKCDNCGKWVTRFGTRSAKAKFHFCDNECKKNFLQKQKGIPWIGKHDKKR